jgi:NAD(P)-dependent dehydrogenase (short-subunit alcohol dehydrogenase family)
MSGAAPIVGAGDATGAAVARVFASKALTACVSRRATNADKLEALAQSIRDHDLLARAFAGDARDEDDVVAMFESIERDVAPLEVVVFNISANVNFPITQTTARLYCKVWEMACFGGFLVGREAARRMIPRQRGTVLFTVAIASLRGGSGYAAFAGAKASLRMLAQSMAREGRPQNIHVAYSNIDGPIDTDFIASRIPDIDAARAGDATLSPQDIVRNYVMVHRQARNAWTHEFDLRPRTEKF